MNANDTGGILPNSHTPARRYPFVTSGAAVAMSAVFIVLSLVSIDNSRLSILRSKQDLELSQLRNTIAPDNLPLAAEIFRTSIAVQDRNFPIGSLTRLPAWTTLQSTLSDYKDRLKLLDAQNRELDHRLQQRSLWASYSALGAIIVSLLLHRIVLRRVRRQSFAFYLSAPRASSQS